VKRHTVLANVLSGALGRSALLPSLALSFPAEEQQRARGCLDRVGLGDRAASRADALSGGQQQRVAIARALMQEPQLILADEPVASLDPALRHSVMRHIEVLNRDEGLTVLCSLHDIDLVARYATRLVALRDGRLVWDGTPAEFDRTTFKEILRRGGGTGLEHGAVMAAPTSSAGRGWMQRARILAVDWALIVIAWMMAEFLLLAFTGRRGPTVCC